MGVADEEDGTGDALGCGEKIDIARDLRVEVAQSGVEFPADAAIIEGAEVAGDEAAGGAMGDLSQAGIVLTPPVSGAREIIEAGGSLLELALDAGDSWRRGIGAGLVEDEVADGVGPSACVGERKIGAEPDPNDREMGQAAGLDEAIQILDVCTEAIVALIDPGAVAVAPKIESKATEVRSEAGEDEVESVRVATEGVEKEQGRGGGISPFDRVHLKANVDEGGMRRKARGLVQQGLGAGSRAPSAGGLKDAIGEHIAGERDILRREGTDVA